MSTLQYISLYVMAGFYFFAGLNHFTKPYFYINIMPQWLRYPELLNKLSGAAEIILAIGLIPLATRKVSAILIIFMLLAFLSVHLSHLFFTPASFGKYGKYLVWIRLPLQFLLIYWAWRVGNYK